MPKKMTAYLIGKNGFLEPKRNAKDEKKGELKLFLNKLKSGKLFEEWGVGNYKKKNKMEK